MKVRDVIARLQADGWHQIKTGPSAGSHRQFKHITKPGRVTIAGGLNDDVHPKTLSSIWRQAAIKQ